MFNEMYEEIATLLEHHADRLVKQGLFFLLRHYRTSSSLTAPPSITCQLITQQLLLGQRAFFGGLWTKAWNVQQDQYNQTRQLKKSSLTWLVST